MSQRDTLVLLEPDDDDKHSKQLHPSLQVSFVALPPAGISLTPEQLQAIFGGDVRVLRDLAQLAYKSDETEAE
jgi:hypothetical protein